MSKNVLNRGTGNPQNTTSYPDTFAGNGGGGGGTADNIIEEVTCDSSVAVGDWVRMSGSTAIKAQANTITNANIIGVAVAKSSATKCNIQVTGFTASVFGGLTIGGRYFLDPTTAGAMTATVPTGAGQIVLLLGTPYTSTQFIVRPQEPLKRAS